SETQLEVIGESDSEFSIEESDFSGDSFVGASGSSMGTGGVSAKLDQLRVSLEQSSIEGAEKSEVEDQLRALKGRLNYLVSLSPQNQQTQLDLIYADLGQLEMRILGLEEGGEIEESVETESESDPEDEFSTENLEETLEEIGGEIRSLLDTGKITQALYDELIGKHGRLEGELDLGGSDAEAVAGMIEELKMTVDGIRLSYIESGEPVDSTEGEDGEDEGSKMIEALRAAANGKSEEQILKALNSSGFIFDDVEDLKKEINDGNFPPKDPSLATIDKLVKVCDNLGLVNEIKGVPWSGDHLLAAFNAATPKVVTLLQAFYPDSNISMTHPAITNKDQWRFGNNITFDGVTFDWTVQKEHSQSTISVAETVYNDAGTNEVS
ncbi:MAG TPA: hypothetical protein VFW62_08085, partial [bacterium]|nr:hypothetical protein [bacterium]